MKNVFFVIIVVLSATVLVIGIAFSRQLRLPNRQQVESTDDARDMSNSACQGSHPDGEVGQSNPPTPIDILQSLSPSITRARTERPEIFKECGEILASVRVELESSRHSSWRPGELQGKLRQFACSGPESRLVTERVGTSTNSIIWRGKYAQVSKFTDDEVEIGRKRNAAARMALLDHLLYSSEEDPPYMQRELVDLIWEWWWKDGKYRNTDSITGEGILDALATNASRPPAIRYAAIIHPPPCERQEIVNAIMSAVLQDDRINDASMDIRMVSDAVRLLKESRGEEGQRLLASASSSVRWKQALINQALGLPPPPLPEDNQAPNEEAIDVEVVL